MHILLTLILITGSFTLNALTYSEQVQAYEEALENQSVEVYERKYQREQERQASIRAAYKRSVMKNRENAIKEQIRKMEVNK